MTNSVFTKRYNRFRELLIAARKEKGLTQVELARKLSRMQSYVSKYERGERRLDVIEFLEITRALNLNPEQFLKQLD